MSGAAAKARFAEVRAKNPSAWARADAAMRARGCRPTEHVIVARSIAHANAKMMNRRSSPTGLLVSDNMPVSEIWAYSADGEVIMWSWDDGDPTTWEGEVYVGDFTTGNQTISDGAFYIVDPNTLPAVWEEPISMSGPTTAAGRALAGEMMYAKAPVATTSQFLLASSTARQIFQDWGWCAAPGCGGVAIDCGVIRHFTGPAWAECFGGACTIVMVGCAVNAAWQAYKRQQSLGGILPNP